MFVTFHLFHFLPLSSKSSAEEMEEMSFFHFLPPVRKKSFLPEETQPCCRIRRLSQRNKQAYIFMYVSSAPQSTTQNVAPA